MTTDGLTEGSIGSEVVLPADMLDDSECASGTLADVAQGVRAIVYAAVDQDPAVRLLEPATVAYGVGPNTPGAGYVESPSLEAAMAKIRGYPPEVQSESALYVVGRARVWR